MTSTASDKLLTAEEQEEKELRERCREGNLYDENMGINEMKEIVKVLNDSIKDSKICKSDVHSSPSSQSPVSKSIQNVKKPTDAKTEMPIPSFSYRNAVDNSLKFQSTPSEEETKKYENDTEINQTNSNEKNVSKENSPENESIHDKDSIFKKEEYPSLRSRTKLEKQQATQEFKKITPAMYKKMNLERMTLDPPECIVNDDNCPLHDPNHPHVINDLSSFFNEDSDEDSEEFDELVQQMCKKLDIIRDEYYDKILSDEKTRWCPPMKGSPNWKPNSQEKNSASDKPPETTSQGIDVSSARGTLDRASKRKALHTIAAVTNVDTNDPNSDDEFVNTKKRKFQQGRKEKIIEKNQGNEKSDEIEIECNNDLDDMNIFDNKELHSLRKNPIIQNSEEKTDTNQYPKRIIPPNPGKKSNKGPRKKNTNQMKLESAKENLNDEEINKILNTIDAQIEETDDIVEITEIKPLPVVKPVTKKMKAACSLLENAQEIKEKREKAEQEAKEQKKREEQLEKDARISKRLQEQENENQKKLEQQRRMDQQDSFYRNVCNSKQKVTRSNYKPRGTYEEVDEDILLGGDDDDEPIPSTSTANGRSPCPICLKSFPSNQIELHASGCNAFEDIVEMNEFPSSIDLMICHICNNFRSKGQDFEEHTINCKERAMNRNNGNALVSRD